MPIEAAKRWGCASAEIKITEDRIGGPDGRAATFATFASLSAEGIFLNKKHTYTCGAHAAHVTVDARIGQVEIVDYLTVVDCGRIINPMTVRGQVIGSLVQGLGGAMLEHLVYDDEGQLLTGSLADYLLPTALEVPRMEIGHTVTPSPLNPLGIKGAGEAGAIPVGPLFAQAIEDALGLSGTGVEILEIPLSPSRLWQLVTKAP